MRRIIQAMKMPLSRNQSQFYTESINQKPLDMEQIVMCAREAYGFTELNKRRSKVC
jgi:hypothetical protein